MLGNGAGEKVASLCLVSSQVGEKEETHTPTQSNQGKFPFIEHLPFLGMAKVEAHCGG